MDSKMDFRLVSGGVVQLVDYVREYLSKHGDQIELWVGTDSQNHKRCTTYATVVAFYDPGHGAHVIYRRWRTPRERVHAVRLLNEAWASIEVSEMIREAGLKKVSYIDLDMNPNPKYKSSECLSQAVGMCEGMGYHVRFKTIGPWSTTVADEIARK